MIKKCVICDNPFDARGQQKACSEKCKRINKLITQMNYNRIPEVKARKKAQNEKYRENIREEKAISEMFKIMTLGSLVNKGE